MQLATRAPSFLPCGRDSRRFRVACGRRAGSAEDDSPPQDVRVRGRAGACAARRRPRQSTQGEFVAVMGPSGCGKSTLLNLVAGLDTPTTARSSLAGESLAGKDENELAHMRRRHIGIVFQFFNLLEGMTALENVALPAVIAGAPRKRAESRARDLLDLLGLADKANELPGVLSGGQRQRLAIARALANEPTLLLADEPTGALDSEGGHEVLELFRRLHAGGQTILLVTHDERVADAAERIVRMQDGRIVGSTIAAPACGPSGPERGRRLDALPSRAPLGLAHLAGAGRARRTRRRPRHRRLRGRPPHRLGARAASRRLPLSRGDCRPRRTASRTWGRHTRTSARCRRSKLRPSTPSSRTAHGTRRTGPLSTKGRRRFCSTSAWTAETVSRCVVRSYWPGADADPARAARSAARFARGAEVRRPPGRRDPDPRLPRIWQAPTRSSGATRSTRTRTRQVCRLAARCARSWSSVRSRRRAAPRRR